MKWRKKKRNHVDRIEWDDVEQLAAIYFGLQKMSQPRRLFFLASVNAAHDFAERGETSGAFHLKVPADHDACRRMRSSVRWLEREGVLDNKDSRWDRNCVWLRFADAPNLHAVISQLPPVAKDLSASLALKLFLVNNESEISDRRRF